MGHYFMMEWKDFDAFCVRCKSRISRPCSTFGTLVCMNSCWQFVFGQCKFEISSTCFFRWQFSTTAELYMIIVGAFFLILFGGSWMRSAFNALCSAEVSCCTNWKGKTFLKGRERESFWVISFRRHILKDLFLASTRFYQVDLILAKES